MKLEHFFLGLSVALLLVTSALMVHYRTELYVERERARHSAAAPSVPTAAYPTTAPQLTQAPVTAPPVAVTTAPTFDPTEPISSESARLDEENLRLKRQLSSTGENTASGATPSVSDPAPAAPTPTQASIAAKPAIAKITRYLQTEGMAEINAGSSQGIKTGQVYAVRRGQYLVAPRLVIGETVETDAAAAMVDVAKLSAGESLKEGDEVIQWE
jgi:hypothetical protein